MSLKLVLAPAINGDPVVILQLMADAAGRGALDQHAVWVLLALAVDSPGKAVLVLVLADGGADAARSSAVRHHVRGVEDTLVVECPDLACGGILIGADGAILADSVVAAVGAGLERVSRVGRAFAVLRPAGAVVVLVLACAGANFAGDRAVDLHEVHVALALSFLGPVVAVIVDVRALGRAKATGSWALLVHVVRRASALALLSPRSARWVPVAAHQRADTAAVGANSLDVLGVVTSALAITGPGGTREVTIVAETDGGENTRQTEHEGGKNWGRSAVHDEKGKVV